MIIPGPKWLLIPLCILIGSWLCQDLWDVYCDSPENIVALFKKCARLYFLSEPEIAVVNVGKLTRTTEEDEPIFSTSFYEEESLIRFVARRVIFPFLRSVRREQRSDPSLDTPETKYITVKNPNLWVLIHSDQCFGLLFNKLFLLLCYSIVLSWSYSKFFPSVLVIRAEPSVQSHVGTHNNRMKKVNTLTIKCDIKLWLIEMEMYFSSHNITRDDAKVLTVFENIDSEVRKLLKHVNDDIAHSTQVDAPPLLRLYNYEGLKVDLCRLFTVGTVDVDLNRRLFSSRTQLDNESLAMFYANLSILFSHGYPDLSREHRTKMICERFINGIKDAPLARDLTNYLSSNKRAKGEVLQKALEIQQMHPARTLKFKLSQPSTCKCTEKSRDSIRVTCPECCPQVSRVRAIKAMECQPRCYHCGCAGHFRRNCPLPSFERPRWISNKDFKRIVKITFPIGKHTMKREVRGVCNINRRLSEYVVDSGAKVTVIHVRCITDDQRPAIMVSPCHVTTANGELLSILGVMYCQIHIGNTATYGDFYITDDEGMKDDCLLGMDVIMNCSLTRDLFETLLDRLEEVHPSEVKTETDVRSPIFDSTAFRVTEIGPEEVRNFEQETFPKLILNTSSLLPVDGSEFSMNDDVPDGGIHHDVLLESPIDLPRSDQNVCQHGEAETISDVLKSVCL